MKSDEHLQRDVLDELEWEPSIDAAQIGVTSHEGVITLTGHLPVYSKKHTAEEAAKRVHGVRAVANEIEVRPSDVHVRDDEDIAAAAVHALEWDVEVPEQDVRLSVVDGWISVEGTVEHRYQRAAVDRVLRHLHGSRGVTNEIDVASHRSAAEVKADLEAAFRRSAVLNSKNVSVDVDDSTVTITGDVHSHAELAEVERMAWSAGGVCKVHNCVTITPWGFGPAEEWGY